MATDDQRHRRPKPSYPRKSSVTLPSPIPRSQYASNAQTNSNHPGTGESGPKYFSSPYRAPLNSRERQQSFVEHQKSVSSVHSSDTQSTSNFPQYDQRSSYSIFGPGPAVESVPIVMRTNSPMRYRDVNSTEPSRHQGPGFVRQASVGHKAKPALTTVRRSGSTRGQMVESTPETPGNMAANALHVAVATAFSQNLSQRSQQLMSDINQTPNRPLDSPTSSYSQDISHNAQHGGASVAYNQQKLGASSTTNPLLLTPPHDHGRMSPLPPQSEKSASSTNPLLGPGIERSNMKDRGSEKQRPLRLDMDAVRRAEARGSITSLPDLIRRATRLAANLDHGRTASNFSVFDMFRSYEKGNGGNRRSTNSDMNDMLAAFPKPTNGDPADPHRPNTMWPSERKGEVFLGEESVTESGSPKRRCCGLSTTSLVIVIVLAILLCAAAVLLPIFLIVVPRQHHSSTDLSKCLSNFPCYNGGISVVDNNACSCVCVGGFNGNDCSGPTSSDCVTMDLPSFSNATVGSFIRPLLTDASTKFNIPLNNTILLSTFATNNFSCTAENSLVQFKSGARSSNKRLFAEVKFKHDLKTAAGSWQVVRRGASQEKFPAVVARQTSVQTTNEIVYQTTQSQAPATQTGSPTATSSTAAAVYTNIPSGGNLTKTIPSTQLEFAKVVVLYTLSMSRLPSIAVLAQQSIEQYFRAGGQLSGNDTVGVMNGGDHQTLANFADLTIILGNGTVLGGNHTKS